MSDETQRLLSNLSGDDPEQQEQACRRLGEIGDASAVEPLIALLSRLTTFDRDDGLRAAAAEALAKIGSPACVPLLTRMLSAEEAGARRGAVWALGFAQAGGLVEQARAVELLTRCLADPNPLVCRDATSALAGVGGEDVVESLIGALSHRHEDVRAQAAKELGRLRAPLAVPMLAQALADPSGQVFGEAVVALGAIGGPAGISALVSALPVHTEMHVRRSRDQYEPLVRALLRKIGPPAVPALAQAIAETLEMRVGQQGPWGALSRERREYGCREAICLLGEIVESVPSLSGEAREESVRALREALPTWQRALRLFSGTPKDTKRELRSLVEITEWVLSKAEGG